MEIEWDSAKRTSNLAKHDIDFLDQEIDFSHARHGAVIPDDPTKTRITIRLDATVIAWFKAQVADNGGSYQSLINEALKAYIGRRDNREELEETLRRVLREELDERRVA